MISHPPYIPEKPGVYLFKAKEHVLYIGKAKDLKKRVSQYFQRKDQPVIGHLLQQAEYIEYIITDDEKDALHLEYNLVHRYKPPFNIRLKDDKSFPMITISTSEPFPGLYYTREVKEGHFYVGPLVDSRKTRELIDLLTRVFKLRSCSTVAFKRAVPCLYYYIDRCSAPCAGKITQELYRVACDEAIEFLKGKKQPVIQRLEQQMLLSAQSLLFEEAQKLKEDLALIKPFVLASYISSVTTRNHDYDVLAVAHDSTENSTIILLITVLEGRVKGREFFNFTAISTNPAEILKEFLISYYSTRNIPHEILLNILPADVEQLQELFIELMGRQVVIKTPVLGKKHKTMLLAQKNLNIYITKQQFNLVGARLQELLQLTRFPHVIEGYDISHLSERDRVGAVVVFEKGEPSRKKYRNYIVKEAAPGDTEALKEVLTRRFKKQTQFPDLLLIDGGIPQLGAALEIKQLLSIPSDLVALAKREERIYLENGQSVLLPEHSAERFLLQNIRDEVHRRAVSHHRQRREKL